jgi:hypothetical protein
MGRKRMFIAGISPRVAHCRSDFKEVSSRTNKPVESVVRSRLLESPNPG